MYTANSGGVKCERMKQQVRLFQLYKSHGKEYIKGTCHVIDGEDGDRFECSIRGDNNYKAQLWQWVSGNWNGKEGIPCDIQFSDVTSEGLPIDAEIFNIHGFQAIYPIDTKEILRKKGFELVLETISGYAIKNGSISINEIRDIATPILSENKNDVNRDS